MRQPTRRLAAALLLAVAASACSRREAAVQEETSDAGVTPVAATPAQRGRLRATIHASGVVTPAPGAEYLVIAAEPARILEISKAPGDSVAPGEPLVRFEAPFAAQEVGRQRAEVARVQAEVENARVAHTRARDLVERGLMARNELDSTERALADAQAQLQRAQGALAAAEASVARAVVRATFAGIVANRLHEVGDVAQATPGDPVLRIVDPGRLEITASVPAGAIARVLAGASARIAGAIGSDQERLTVAGSPNIAERTADGNIRVRLSFLAPTRLTIDTPVQIDIDAEERNDVLFVSPDALVPSGGETALFVAVGDRAQRRVVTTGVEDGQGIEITSGLNAGDLVITRGQATLADGAPISATIER